MSTSSIPIPQEDDPFWGAEVFDGHWPIRAHVLAALRPVDAPYPPAVDALRRLGDVRTIHPELGRITAAITPAHVPDLIRMARDRHLFAAPADSPDVWAQLHALYCLAELDFADHVDELIPLLDVNSDWLRDSLLPELFAEVGPAAVPALQAYLGDPNRWAWGHYTAARALQQIAAANPESHSVAVTTLTAMLEALDVYSDRSCTAAMDMLVELRAVEALPQIYRAFVSGKLDPMTRGGWDEILLALDVPFGFTDPSIIASTSRHRHTR